MANMSFTNNAATTLASGITNVATSLTVASGTGSLFPTLTGSQYFYCTLANNSGTVEIVKVTARTTDTFTITRAQDNTSAVAWNLGDKVELRLVAASLNDFPKLDETNTFTQNQTMPGLTLSTTPLAVASGGTGSATLTANNVLLGNGTSAVQVVAPSTSGNVLTSNGTTWASTALPANAYVGGKGQAFTANGTFTIPTSITAVKVTVVGGGGGGAGGIFSSVPCIGTTAWAGGPGGGGGTAISFLTGLTPGNTLAVTIGSAGGGGASNANGSGGGTSSVASGTQTITTISSTGGGGGVAQLSGAGGLGSGGTINIGGGGGAGNAVNNAGYGGGTGGSSTLGGGGRGTSTTGQAPVGGYGGGGGSGYSSYAGAAGSAGIVIFEW